MSKAIKILDQIQELAEELNSGSRKMYKQLSELDKQMSQIYHEAEVNEFNKDDGYELMIKLQNIARKRREIKMEISCFDKASMALELNDEFNKKMSRAKGKVEAKQRENMQYAHWMKEENNTYIEA
ncbi:hypothetical protein [Priestia megaterium]|uniref:hypothetical protein n=1 Tax=Priestia megaterium TaxID=1404 RepID=UPI003CC563CD